MTNLLRHSHAPDADGCVLEITPQRRRLAACWISGESPRAGQAAERRRQRPRNLYRRAGGHCRHRRREPIASSGIGGRSSVFDDASPGAVYVPAGMPFTVTRPGRGRTGGLLGARGSRAVRRAQSARATCPRQCAARAPTPATSATFFPKTEAPTVSSWSRSSPRAATGRAIRRTSTTRRRREAKPLSRRPTIIESILPRASRSNACTRTTAIIDETMCVHDGDLVLVPRGYHPVAPRTATISTI